MKIEDYFRQLQNLTWRTDEYGEFAANYSILSAKRFIEKFGTTITDDRYEYSLLGLINDDHYSFTREAIN